MNRKWNTIAYFADSDHSFRSKSISRFAPCRSPGSVDVDVGDVGGTDARFVSGGVGGIGCGEAAEGAAGEGDPVGMVDQPVEDGPRHADGGPSGQRPK